MAYVLDDGELCMVCRRPSIVMDTSGAVCTSCGARQRDRMIAPLGSYAEADRAEAALPGDMWLDKLAAIIGDECLPCVTTTECHSLPMANKGSLYIDRMRTGRTLIGRLVARCAAGTVLTESERELLVARGRELWCSLVLDSARSSVSGEFDADDALWAHREVTCWAILSVCSTACGFPLDASEVERLMWESCLRAKGRYKDAYEQKKRLCKSLHRIAHTLRERYKGLLLSMAIQSSPRSNMQISSPSASSKLLDTPSSSASSSTKRRRNFMPLTPGEMKELAALQKHSAAHCVGVDQRAESNMKSLMHYDYVRKACPSREFQDRCLSRVKFLSALYSAAWKRAMTHVHRDHDLLPKLTYLNGRRAVVALVLCESAFNHTSMNSHSDAASFSNTRFLGSLKKRGLLKGGGTVSVANVQLNSQRVIIACGEQCSPSSMKAVRTCMRADFGIDLDVDTDMSACASPVVYRLEKKRRLANAAAERKERRELESMLGEHAVGRAEPVRTAPVPTAFAGTAAGACADLADCTVARTECVSLDDYLND